MAINACEQSIASDIKLPPIDEERVFNVLLKDSSFILLRALISHYVFDLLEVSTHYDATSPICVLSWLDDPDVGMRAIH